MKRKVSEFLDDGNYDWYGVTRMWNQLPDRHKNEYKRAILLFSSLTELFAQKTDDQTKLIPYISSKFQETMFIRSFGAVMEDIGNTSFDASLMVEVNGEIKKCLIGIKTFRYDTGFQKVAQFKNNHNEWSQIINNIEKNSKDAYGKPLDKQVINERNYDNYRYLAESIATIRNRRIRSSLAKIRGFKIDKNDCVEQVYHVLMPALDGSPLIMVGETSYDEIDVGELYIEGCSRSNNPTNFEFRDGNHKYRFTSADSQLLMDFNNKEIVVERWDVMYADDPYSLFMSMDGLHPAEITIDSFDTNDDPNIIPKITESYVWSLLNSEDEVEKYSGFNSFYGTGSKISTNDRQKRIDSIKTRYVGKINETILESILLSLEKYLIKKPGIKQNAEDKLLIRNDIEKLLDDSNNEEFAEDVRKLVYRPFDEMYIPIPDSKVFHKNHPDFFAPGAAEFKPGTCKLSKPKESRRFNLVFEPSGDSIPAYITQDNGKAIESYDKQTILGHWIRNEVFQLKKYQPLTAEWLTELEINAIKLYKIEGSDDIHLEFIWDDDLYSE